VSARGGLQANDGFNVSAFFDEALEVAASKTLPFASTGIYTVDMFLDGIKVTDGKIAVEVVNVTVQDFSPRIVSTSGGAQVILTGTDFPTHHPVSVVIVAANFGAGNCFYNSFQSRIVLDMQCGVCVCVFCPGMSDIQVGADVSDDKSTATIRMPQLPAGQYYLTLRLSQSEEIHFTHDKVLNVFSPFPFGVSSSPACILKAERSNFQISLRTTILRQDVALMSGARYSVKFLSDTNPSATDAKQMQLKSFFDTVDGALNAHGVTLVMDGDVHGPILNVSAKFSQV
jgi:hypothetical protein